MKNKTFLLCLFMAGFTVHALWATAKTNGIGTYRIVIEGYDWGPAVNKVILSLDETVSSADAKDYTVFVKRSTDKMELPAEQASGTRTVLHAYVSDAEGNKATEGKYVTLVLLVSPDLPLGSPIQYMHIDGQGSNDWIDYQLTVIQTSANRIWNREVGRIMPLIDRFDLSGKFTFGDGPTMSYASYQPASAKGKRPLIIWLHGGGEGGTDPSIPLIANRAANYAADDIQAYFGGAYVLVPQSPTFWMDDGTGSYTRGDKNDRYNEALMALIKKYMTDNPNIDPDRIYVGGCSNGGYMTLKLILLHPDFFAAAFPSALAYHAEFVTDQQIKSIKNMPIWFVHSKDDGTTLPDKTVVPVYQRLQAAGAKDVHFSYYDHVVDITGFFGGNDYYYPGHWSWIYGHANLAKLDFDGQPVMLDGKPVTIMEWMAGKSR